ncbi:hypothetical protein Tco_0352015 [Tanacetum coccineum]
MHESLARKIKARHNDGSELEKGGMRCLPMEDPSGGEEGDSGCDGCWRRGGIKGGAEALKVWSKAKFGDSKQHIESCKKEAMRWEVEAESRILNEEELKVWLEARKAWLDKESK